MPPTASSGVRSFIARNRALIFPVLIVASILVILAPLPPLLMDLLLACNVTVSVVILLTTIHVDRPLDFSVFPALLLGTTLARLVLNVASTRLILTNGAGPAGTQAAGGVIEAFGQFVAGGNLMVGLVIFSILIVIQFLVITKGATRISEVAARFALDGLPGRQMAIDADLNAGVINGEEARQRREDLTRQADFYGAMDGASKFVRGDSMASIAITLINIVGGLYVGMVDHQMSFGRAVEVFTTLTIGDGLVTQVPAFLISLAAGLLVTRSSHHSNLSQDVAGQLISHPVALFLSAGFLASMSFTGLPMLPLLTLAAVCAVTGMYVSGGKSQQAQRDAEAAAAVENQANQREPQPQDDLHVVPMELELGIGLLKLADSGQGGDLLDRVTRVRHKIARELGILLPKVRITDNIRLGQRKYEIKIRGVAVAWGECYPNAVLAIESAAGRPTEHLPGIETTDPAFGRPARWIEPGLRERAEQLGYQIASPSAVMITHLTEVVRNHSWEILSRQQVHQLLDHLRGTSPKVVDEVIPGLLQTSELQQVLCRLLRERVPVRDLETILESLSHHATQTRDLAELTERVRRALSRTICQQYRDARRNLQVVTLDPAFEQTLAGGYDSDSEDVRILGDPAVAAGLKHSIEEQVRKLEDSGRPPVLLCSPGIRRSLRSLMEVGLPRLVVMSYDEITPDTEVESIGTVNRHSARVSMPAP